MNLPSTVTLYEVGPRDGLQNVEHLLSVDAKVKFIHALAATGLQAIESGAFVSARYVPQMQASAEVFQQIIPASGVRYSALVPNMQGLKAALQVGVQEVAVFTAASETFNGKNINASIANSLERFRPVLDEAARHGLRVRGYVSTCFGCPYEGAVGPEKVHEVTRALFAMGIHEVALGDTIGVAVPTQIEAVVDPLLDEFGSSRIALHFHDTRGTALANVMRAVQLGVTIFDSSAGGLGGCPYAPGATGNVATEDLVYLFEQMNVSTGVDLEALVRASKLVQDLLGLVLPSRVLRAHLALGQN